MDYKEMIKLRALEIELNKQRDLAWKRIHKHISDGKSIYTVEYDSLVGIKDFYKNAVDEINQKF
jgi:hypothetical protein